MSPQKQQIRNKHTNNLNNRGLRFPGIGHSVTRQLEPDDSRRRGGYHLQGLMPENNTIITTTSEIDTIDSK